MSLFSGGGKCCSTKKLDGKTAIVTGCNSGLGKETAKDFYRRGAKVIMACRNLDKAYKAKVEIQRACKQNNETGAGGILKVAKCDLSSIKSIKEFAKHILDTEPQINILVNNAGVMMCPYTHTEDGFEMQFGTNHLGHFLLTMLLLPRIKNSTPARIVTVASKAYAIDILHLDDLNYKNTPYKPLEAYAQSKLANVMFSRELAAKLQEHNIEGVNTYSLYPGISKTQITRYINQTLFRGAKALYRIFMSPFAKSAEQGAQTTIYCSIDDICAQETGLFYSDCTVTPLYGKAVDNDLSKILWNTSMELVGLKDTDPFTTPDSGVIYTL